MGRWNFLKYPLSKQNKQKKMFLEGICQLSGMVWPTIKSVLNRGNYIREKKGDGFTIGSFDSVVDVKLRLSSG